MSFSPQVRLVLPRCVAVFAATLLLCTLGPPSRCQVDTAAVNGSVTDSTGAYVLGASIVLENTSTGTEQTTTTNKDGAFNLVGVLPGHYQLLVSAKSFANTTLQNIVLNVGDQRTVQVKLHAGTQASITVDASGSTLNTTDASVGTVIDRKFVENIPLNGRSFQDLISLTPGVVTQSPQSTQGVGEEGDFSVNGQRTQSNYYIIDGVSGNVSPGNGEVGVGGNGTIAASTALGTTQSLLSVDALQEFRVESSTYSAEYGHGPGGQFSFVTRSGTNTPHGTAFDYLRNSYFDANNWFNDELSKPEAPLRQNDFGGTFGGPVWLPWVYDGRKKTFLFVSYEGLRLTQPQAATIQYVPDLALRQQASPALQPLLNAFPLPTQGAVDYGSASNPSLAQFIQSYSLPSQINSTSLRLDHTLRLHNHVFFRFGDTPSSTSSRVLSSLTTTHVNATSYTFGVTSQLSDKMTNEFRLGYSNNNSALDITIDSFGGATPTNAASDAGSSSYKKPFTLFYLYLPLGGSSYGSSSIDEEASGEGVRNWNAVDTVSILQGHHQIKLGVDFNRLKSVYNNYSPLVEAFYYATQALTSNQATALYAQQNVNSIPITYNVSAFIQDEWKITSRLNLSLGLRWEVDPAPHGHNGNDAYTLLGSIGNPSTLMLAPRGTPLWATYWYNFAPRLGVAWQAHNQRGRETVVRGGAGIFFDTYNGADTLGFTGLGFSAIHSYAAASLPLTHTQLDFSPSVTPPYTSGVVYAFPDHLQVPYTLEWNGSIEQGLGIDQTLTISYIGANGKRLITEQQGSIAALNPEFGNVTFFPSGITSNYQALQTKFQRTVGRGIQALVSYTWSHAIDFGSNYSTYAATRGNADFDVRHNVQAGISWDLPTFKSNPVSALLLGHWGVDGRFMARTGYPITLSGNELTDPATGAAYESGVNLVPGKPLYLYGSKYPGGRALNGGPEVPASSAAFTLPSGTSEGDAPRNFVRGFGENQVNFAVRRIFPIKGSVSLQFRAEAFNILNHPNFGLIDYTLTSPQFGLATQTLNQSLATLASQYQQGGPRSMQFALKLTF